MLIYVLVLMLCNVEISNSQVNIKIVTPLQSQETGLVYEENSIVSPFTVPKIQRF